MEKTLNFVIMKLILRDNHNNKSRGFGVGDERGRKGGGGRGWG